MPNSKNLKTYLSYESLKLFIRNFRKKISRSYLLIEFGFDYLNICEAIFVKSKINFRNIKYIEIPSEAMEKGIPNDPETMGKLIQDTLKEENILTSRVAIVISQDSVYTRLIDIPNSIKEKKVESYMRDPKSLIQVPIQLSKSDFSIRKTNYDLNNNKNLYFLTAMPKASMNNLIKVCKIADLELNYVETGFKSISRLVYSKYLFSDKNTILILLDFGKQCTFLTLLNEYGPISTDRISSIRNYPFANSTNSSKNESEYLPISKYDLKVLEREIKKSLNNFFLNKQGDYNFKLILSGFNSAHPNLTKELSEFLKMPAYLISPTGSKEFGQINYVDENFYECIFTKLFGLSLGLIDPMIADELANISSNDDSLRFIEKNFPLVQSTPDKRIFNQIRENKNNKKNTLKKANNIEEISTTPKGLYLKKNTESEEEMEQNKKLKLIENKKDIYNSESYIKENSEMIDKDKDKGVDNSNFKLDTDFLESND